jgi:ParB family chromosome partitioning protein
MAADISMPLPLDEIEIPEGRRPVDPAAVKRLADSIEQIGLKHPITVRRKGERYILVAGLHRLEACRKIGREHVPSIICTMTNAEARMWEIAENLHRAELTKLQRAEYIEEWRELVLKNSTPVQPAEAGVRKTADKLGIDPAEVIASRKIASILPEAKEAAREAGIDDKRSKLLEIAREAPEHQVATVHRIAAEKAADRPLSDVDAIERQVASLMTSWNKASPEARKEFLGRIDTPIMDRQFA